MNKLSIGLVAAVLAVGCFGTSAFAGKYKFRIHNDASAPIEKIYSTNWHFWHNLNWGKNRRTKAVTLPGEYYTLSYNNCKVLVGFKSKEPLMNGVMSMLDICKNPDFYVEKDGRFMSD